MALADIFSPLRVLANPDAGIQLMGVTVRLNPVPTWSKCRYIVRAVPSRSAVDAVPGAKLARSELTETTTTTTTKTVVSTSHTAAATGAAAAVRDACLDSSS